MGQVRFSQRTRGRALFPVAAAMLLCSAGMAVASMRDTPFPRSRAAARVEAIRLLESTVASKDVCLTAGMQHRWQSHSPTPLEIRQAVLDLSIRRSSGRSETYEFDGGWVLSYAATSGTLGGIDLTDTGGDGRPDLVEAVLIGLEDARQILVDQLGLPMPADFEVVLTETGDRTDGYLLPPGLRSMPTTVVLDATPRLGLEGAKRSAVHQFAHAVGRAAGPALSSGWSEALALWTVLQVEGRPDETTTAALNRRLARLDAGLFVDDPALGAGNALWLAYLEQAHGPQVVRAVIEELSRGIVTQRVAMEHALLGGGGTDLASAFRDFHVWSVLVGPRSDGRHFSFASFLTAPPFASWQEGLPALSVQADPAVRTFGAAQVQLLPQNPEGGLRVRFEGEPMAGWDADLLIVGRKGSLRRLPLNLSDEGRGERSLPLDGVGEVLLLIRRTGEVEQEQRYTYSAHHDAAFPFVLSSLNAVRGQDEREVFVSWETSSEERLVGFNILRYRKGNDQPVAINPVWIPALGDPSLATAYHFVDRSALPGVAYSYRIQAITLDGLTSESAPSEIRRPASR